MTAPAYAELGDRIRREDTAELEARKHTLRAWLRRSDVLVNELEELNRQDVTEVPERLVGRVTAAARRLQRYELWPPVPVTTSVQEALDYMFDGLQKLAMGELAGDTSMLGEARPPEDSGIREQLLKHLHKRPGSTATDLVVGLCDREAGRVELAGLVEDGVVRVVVMATGGMPSSRYWPSEVTP